MKLRFKQVLAGAVLTAALVGGGAAIANAQTSSTSSTSTPSSGPAGPSYGTAPSGTSSANCPNM